jgi:REP element-mobilizing transposase RayT
MPRQARLDAPGVLHHIMIRGIERRKIFLNEKDQEDFLERLSKLLPQTQTACYAWAFLSNHAHFLFRTGLFPLSSVMRRLLTGYAVSFNRRHKRNGPLFQNRYKSIVCQEDTYLKELVRYIHLNPIRSGIVAGIKELNKYPYCGHSSIMAYQQRPWQDLEYVLRYFGSSASQSRKAYLDFIKGGIEQGRRKDLIGGGLIRSFGGWAEVRQMKSSGYEHVMSDERILGDSFFVDNILSQADEKYERHYELKRLGYDAERVARIVGEIYDVDPDEFLSKGNQQVKVKARSLFCFWAVKELGMSLRELARGLKMSSPAIGYAVERGEVIARENGYRLIE